MLITKKHLGAGQWNSNDYQVYKSLVAQTKVKSFPNLDHIAEVESEDTDDTDSVEPDPDIASIGNIGETFGISSPGILPSDSGISSSDPSIPSSLHTRSYGKA